MATKIQKYVVTAKVRGQKRDAISQPLDKKKAEVFAKRLKEDMKNAIPEYKVFTDIKVEVDKYIGEIKLAKKKQKLDEGLVMISSLLPVGGLIGMPPKRKDNFKFKGLPGQFNEHGEKVLDEFGDPIKEDKPVVKEEQDAKYYKNLLADVEDGLSELVAVGADYGIFQNAKFAANALKQAYKLVNKVK